MFGLTDYHIARTAPNLDRTPGHQKVDIDYVLKRKPDLIAGWIEPSGGLTFGTTRSRYREAQYEIAFLVNVREDDPHSKIVLEVHDKSFDEIRPLIEGGYRFAVLRRKAKQEG